MSRKHFPTYLENVWSDMINTLYESIILNGNLTSLDNTHDTIGI